MTISLQPVTAGNWLGCIALRVSESQSHMVASNVYSLAEAWVFPQCIPLAIYDDDTLIGFLMYGCEREYGTWWISRFMIDERYQGSGYGRRALAELIEQFKREPECKVITISLVPENTAARSLYQKAGFAETGERIAGEDVLSLVVSA